MRYVSGVGVTHWDGDREIKIEIDKDREIDRDREIEIDKDREIDRDR